MILGLFRKQATSISILYILTVLSVTGCRTPQEKAMATNGVELSIRYATGFTVRRDGNKKWVEVKTPFQGAQQGIRYLLIPRDAALPEVESDVKVIRIPVASIVCTSTSHLPLLEYLGEERKLVGFPSIDYISSEKIRAMVDSGKVVDVGIDKSMTLERLASLRPEMVMGYTMSSDYGQFKKMEELGVPVVINSEYLEEHPLGRAEWIKFMSLFFNKEHEADSIFNAIEHQYLDTKQLVDSMATRPTALSGIVYGDAWFLPGGHNYAAKILRDAGCHYLWEDNVSTGFLQLDLESVYEKAHGADLWIGVGSNETLKSLGDSDHRYKKFKAFETGQVYTYDARKGAKGGSVYLELGYLRPDIILRDLVKIAHPELQPDYELYFHKKLE